MDFFKKHVDTVVILGGILSSVLWMNNKFAGIEKEITIIKTVLLVKEIMPKELAASSAEIRKREG